MIAGKPVGEERRGLLAEASKWSLRAWAEGLVFGLPIIFPITWNGQHRRLLAGEATTWATGRLDVFTTPWTTCRKPTAGIIAALLLAVMFLGYAH